MAHLKLNTAQWLELGEKLGYIKESTDMSSFINESENDTYNNEEIEQLISELEDQLLLQSDLGFYLFCLIVFATMHYC